jgi:hypothetical protein
MNESGLKQQLPRITEVLGNDEFREVLNYAFICKEHIFASDAHMLVRLNTPEHFTDEIIKQIPEDGLLFDRYTCRALQEKNIIDYSFVNAGDQLLIRIDYAYGKILYFPIRLPESLESNHVKKPGGLRHFFDQVLPKDDEKLVPVEKIGIRGTFAARIQKALGDEHGVQLWFYGNNKGIFVKPITGELEVQGRIGLLMPIMIT